MSEEISHYLNQVLVIAFVMPLLLSGVLIFFILIYQKRKYHQYLERQQFLVRSQELLIEKKDAVERERNRIASEMHDDLGAGLTTIRYLSERALRNVRDEKEADEIRKIGAQSANLVRSMGEIIWAMNSRFDSLGNLVSYMRRYASEYLESQDLPMDFVVEAIDADQVISGEKRRNIFLAFKEILHNSVKHAGAEHVQIRLKGLPGLVVEIREQGARGFDPDDTLHQGNGIYNIRKRVSEVGGDIHFIREGEDMIIRIHCPPETE